MISTENSIKFVLYDCDFFCRNINANYFIHQSTSNLNITKKN